MDIGDGLANQRWRPVASGAPMSRLGAIFVIACMVLIAGSSGAVFYLLFGQGAAESALVALGVLIVLTLANTAGMRMRDSSDLAAQIGDLSRGTADLARQVAEIGRRTAALEHQIEVVADKARSATTPLTAELGELGTLVKQLAETVALHELRLANTLDLTIDETTGADAAPIPELGEPEAVPPPANAADATPSPDTMMETIRAAIDANRVDLYLQPIVTLPQRKVRFYEAFTRLRREDGTLLLPADFLESAEAGGLLPRIDHLLLFRCVQIVRRLQLKNRDIGLFCNISVATLNDSTLFPQLLQFMDANRALAPSLIMELKQDAMLNMGPLEQEGLAALRELGFRFCIDQVTDLRMDPRDLGERGIRYVKVTAAFLLGQADAPGADIHAADLSDLLGRFGISLIAERIEAEAQVVDLLDYDVRFGQGFLFSPPRPVRAEALQGAAEEPPARETRDRPASAAAGVAL
jgi:cyclic-di-GMP phosphodiesterase TipF (flagellum assembly factor)